MTLSIRDVELIIDDKYRRGEQLFRSGQMRSAVEDLYSKDIYYLKPSLQLLRGRESVIEFFESLKAQIAEVTVQPMITWGDPAGVVYQFCNTERQAPGGGASSRAHYIAAFRNIEGEWLCEMEVPAAGHMNL